MRNALYQYLILNGQLSLPGIGTFRLQKTSSEYNFGEKIFTAPIYTLGMDPHEERSSKKLYDWLSGTLRIPVWDAIRLVNDFSFDLKNKIAAEGKAVLFDVGFLHRDEKGNIVLDAKVISPESEKSVPAEKVVREKAEHTVLVGETEKTSFEMEELLAESAPRKDVSWIIAWTLAGLTVLFLGWYFSQQGLHPAAAGNQSVIHAK